MNLHVLDIPEKPPQVAEWLERHVVGLRLAELVAELDAVHGGTERVRMSMERSLGSLLTETLENGLTVLGKDRLRWFLQYPEWLLELQERVLLDGGSYWDHVAERSRSDADAILERDHDRLRRFVMEAPEASGVQTRPSVAPRRPSSFRRETLLPVLPYALTAALAVLLTVFVQMFVFPRGEVAPPDLAENPVVDPKKDDPSPSPTPPAWGWNRPDALEAKTDREYLLSLADGAHEWFAKKPETPEALARRIGSFRMGCSRLLLDEHEILGAEDRAWLAERCRVWADALDRNLARLEGGEDVGAVRDATDQTISKLVDALRKRAEQS